MGSRGWAVAGLVGVGLVVLGPPAWAAVEATARAALASGRGGAFDHAADGLTWSGLLEMLAIATGATALGWPLGAWLAGSGAPAGKAARRSGLWNRWGRACLTALLLAPLLLPDYLVSSAVGLLRDPSTATGRWILSALDPDGRVALGRWLAVGGLMLRWAPLAALAVLPALARSDSAMLQARSLEPGRFGRTRLMLRLGWAGAAAGFGLTLVASMGSPVALHLAQVQTPAIQAWRDLAELPRAAWPAVWVSAWPTMVAAAAAAAWGAWTLARSARRGDAGPGPMPPRAGAGSGLMAVAFVAVAVVGPLVLFVAHLAGWASLTGFIGEHSGAIAASLSSAAVAGAVAGVVAWCSLGLMAAGRAAPRLIVALTAAWLMAAMVPGVIVGSWLAIASSDLPGWLTGGPGGWMERGGPALAGAARFGAVAVVAAWVCARHEPAALSDLRRIDGATGPTGVLRGLGPGAWSALAGAGLAVGTMTLHEIEATIQVWQPGVPSLAQVMLNELHFNRTPALVAGCVVLLVPGLVLGAGAGLLVAQGGPRPDRL